MDNIKQEYKNEEEKQKIENEHKIDIKMKELDLIGKIEEYKNKEQKDKNNYNLEILKNKNKTEYEENKLNKELILQEQNIENDKKKALLNIDYNQEEQLMKQEIEAYSDEMLLQMLTAKIMENSNIN